MTLPQTIGTIAAALGVAGTGAVEIWDYEYNHKPAFRVVEAEARFDRCIRECKETCAANDVQGECKCPQCKKYLEGE